MARYSILIRDYWLLIGRHMRSFFMDSSPYSKTEYFFITKQIKKHTLQKNSKNSATDKKHLSIFYKPKEI